MIPSEITYTHDFGEDPPGTPDVGQLQVQLDLVKAFSSEMNTALQQFLASDATVAREHIRLYMLHTEVLAQLNANGITAHEECACATTGNIADLTAPPATIDGFTLVSGTRVLVWQQTDPIENGVYVFNSGTGELDRATDWDAATDFSSTATEIVAVTGGTTYSQWTFAMRELAPTPGTDAQTIVQMFSSGASEGALAELITGTETAARTWAPKTIADFAPQVVQVADIDNPGAELGLLTGQFEGQLFIVYQTGSEITIYSWTSTTATVRAPWRVDGSAGQFVGRAGRNCSEERRIHAESTGDTVLSAREKAATFDHFQLLVDGTMKFGDGTAAPDTSLEYMPSAAGVRATQAFGVGDRGTDTIAADQNDYAPTDIDSVFYYTLTVSGANRTITGMAYGSGQLLCLECLGPYSLILTDNDGASSFTNRFYFGGANVMLPPGAKVFLYKDHTGGIELVGGHGYQYITDLSSATTISQLSGTLVRLLTSTAAGAFTATLPAAPSDLEEYTFEDVENNAGSAAVTIDGNGKLFYVPRGSDPDNSLSATTLILNKDSTRVRIRFSSALDRWVVVEDEMPQEVPYQIHHEAIGATGTTTSATYADLGLTAPLINVKGPGARKFFIRVSTGIGVSNASAVAELTLERRLNGGAWTPVTLTGSATSLCAASMASSSDYEPSTFCYEDTGSGAGVGDTLEYRLVGRVSAGTMYVGRRASDTAIFQETTIEIEERG